MGLYHLLVPLASEHLLCHMHTGDCPVSPHTPMYFPLLSFDMGCIEGRRCSELHVTGIIFYSRLSSSYMRLILLDGEPPFPTPTCLRLGSCSDDIYLDCECERRQVDFGDKI